VGRSGDRDLAVRAGSDDRAAADRQAAAREGIAMTPQQTFKIDQRWLPPLLITCILISAHFTFGILEGFERTGTAIAVAIGAELLMGKITYGRWPHPASAY